MSQTLKRHNQELIILNRIAEALNREVALPRALHTALANIVELFQLDTGWIFLIDPATQKFYTAATIGLPPALADHPRRMGGTCYCIDSYVDGDMEGAANINAILCTRLKDLKEGTEGIQYHASIPLYAQDKQLGVLNVASTDWREINHDDLRLLHTVGDLMSMAIERASLFQSSAEIGAINERNRLARDIHDTIAQGLAAIALQLETADALLDSEGEREKIQATIQRALSLTRINLEEARRSVLDLRAVPLENRNLPDAIRDLLNEFSITTQFDIVGSCPPLPNRIATPLYRIAQEALNNVQQHAQATRIDVQLILTPERIRLVVEDDGVGFSLHDISEKRFGLIGLRERTRLLDGRVDIASTPERGTIIEVTIPLEN